MEGTKFAEDFVCRRAGPGSMSLWARESASITEKGRVPAEHGGNGAFAAGDGRSVRPSLSIFGLARRGGRIGWPEIWEKRGGGARL